MSHDIDQSTGEPAMAYVGKTPWHGLGELLDEDQPIDTWIKAAKLEWQIEMLPVRYHFNGLERAMDDRFVLARSDTGDALSVVASDYHAVQPREVLEFYRDLVDKSGYRLETAGALDGGRKVWALAKTGLVKDVVDAADQLGAYLLLATSCDKSIATTATFTSVRVVCQNTLGFAFQDVKGKHRRHIKVDHSRQFDPAPIKEALGLFDGAWNTFMDRVHNLAGIKLDQPQAREYFESLFQSDKERIEAEPLSPSRARDVHQLMSIYKSARGQDTSAAKGTLWGALNAATHFVDHVRTVGSGDRIDNAWFGTGARLKEKAWARALQVAGLPTDSIE